MKVFTNLTKIFIFPVYYLIHKEVMAGRLAAAGYADRWPSGATWSEYRSGKVDDSFIAEKNDDKLTKNKNGKVILVKLIAKIIFSSSPEKPGAIKNTNSGINISIIRTRKNNPNTRGLNTLVAKTSASSFPLVNSEA